MIAERPDCWGCPCPRGALLRAHGTRATRPPVTMADMSDTADVRSRALADLRLAAEHGGEELRAAARTAFVAGVEPFQIADVAGIDEQQVREILGTV